MFVIHGIVNKNMHYIYPLAATLQINVNTRNRYFLLDVLCIFLNLCRLKRKVIIYNDDNSSSLSQFISETQEYIYALF